MMIGLLTASVSRQGGGLFDVVKGLARCVASSTCDHKVVTFGVEDHETGNDLGTWDGMTVKTFAVRGTRLIGYAPGLFPAVLAANLDILHVHGLWKYPSMVSLRWATRTGRPIIISPHGMLERWAMLQARWKKRAAGWLYENRHLRRAACLHAVCADEAETMREAGFRNPICVIPNAVDVPGDEPSDLPSWHRAVPEGARVALYLGRLHPKKNIDGLLRGWGWVHAGGTAASDWWLVIAGWDQDGHEQELRELVRTLAIPRVVFAGPQFGDQKAATFRRADAFVLTSHSEGLPLTVLEALAHRLPAVITRECNVPEAFRVGAAMAVARDSEGIAEGLSRLMRCDESDRRLMGQAGRKLVEDNFTWKVMGQRILAVYRWILGQGDRPDSVVQ
jgi:glycosyltransferase involved in cell wall biosynthesis